MARSSALAGIRSTDVPLFQSVLKSAGMAGPATIARLDVAELGRLAPDVLVCDIDEVKLDGFELLRRIRFVAPDSLIAVYSGSVESAWARTCHLSGANCLLSKGSNRSAIVGGLRDAMASGCFTDPRFAS